MSANQAEHAAAVAATLRTNLGLARDGDTYPGGAWAYLARAVGYGDVEWLTHDVETALYGIDYARRAGRLSGTHALALRPIIANDWDLCELIGQVVAHCTVAGQVPAFLIRYLDKPTETH